VRVFADAAARLGIRAVLATDRCHVLDDPWRDNAIPVRFDRPPPPDAGDTSLAIPPEVRAIVAVGDAPAEWAAHLAALRNLPFHPPQAARAARSKSITRERFAAAGLPVPHWCEARDDTAARFPCVLKPTGLSASRGVIRANSQAEYAAALARIRAILGGAAQPQQQQQTIIVEDYIPGREFAVEGLMRAGRLYPLAIFDKPDPLEGPFFEETIYVTPSREPDAVQQALLDTTHRAVAALGLTDGPIHAELRYNQHGAWPLEVAARPIGGLCARALQFAPDHRSLEEVILRNALGLTAADGHPSSLRLAPGASGVMMIPIPRRGLYQSVEGVDAARAVPLIEDVVITAKQGQLIEPLPEGKSYLGFLFARAGATSAAAVEQALRRAHGCLRFHFNELIDLIPGSSIDS
jgi:hypothetical protein